MPTALSDENINQGLVCAHKHSLVQTQKILTFMSFFGYSREITAALWIELTKRKKKMIAVGVHFDAYELILFKLDVVVDIAKVYTLILV